VNEVRWLQRQRLGARAAKRASPQPSRRLRFPSGPTTRQRAAAARTFEVIEAGLEVGGVDGQAEERGGGDEDLFRWGVKGAGGWGESAKRGEGPGRSTQAEGDMRSTLIGGWVPWRSVHSISPRRDGAAGWRGPSK
jgi:hypothetical protein